jgi:hypothetical protein
MIHLIDGDLHNHLLTGDAMTMLTIQKVNFLFFLLLITVVLVLSSQVTAQETSSPERSDTQIAGSKHTSPFKQASPASPDVPVYTEFMGVKLGMSANEVRQKLSEPKNKSDLQDFFVLSDSQTAQIVYDKEGNVTTISVDYTKDSTAPTPESVIGEPVQPRPDGSVYHLKRYAAAGYWVAYSRTAGDNPNVTVTMQRM